jgi:hypothetical protein
MCSDEANLACTNILKTVIPAQAGTHNPYSKSVSLAAYGGLLWVPACAGMTV